jgi:hypothetical protein
MGARPLERPSPVRRSGAIWLPTRWLMAGDLQRLRTWDKHRLRTGVSLHSDQPAIYGGETREQLAMESGCEGAANAGSTRSSGRAAGCTCILAPGAATYRAVSADGGRSVTFRAWLPTREGSPQADQATQIAARLLPVAMSRMPTGLARKRFAWSWLTRPPVIRAFARLPSLPSMSSIALSFGRIPRSRLTGTTTGRQPDAAHVTVPKSATPAPRPGVLCVCRPPTSPALSVELDVVSPGGQCHLLAAPRAAARAAKAARL